MRLHTNEVNALTHSPLYLLYKVQTVLQEALRLEKAVTVSNDKKGLRTDKSQNIGLSLEMQ
jgi:hypothetical protein